jgi:hypothetical protein
MDKALDRLEQAARHLKAIEKYFLKNVPAYARNEAQLKSLGRFYDEFARHLYAGGRKEGGVQRGNRYHRGMMLADLLTYALLARGYYISTASDEHRRAFVEIAMRTINKLLIQENISTDLSLRNGLLDALSSLGLTNFFEDDEQKARFVNLRRYKGAIIWGKEGQQFYKIMDAVLPKSRGLAIEFLIYLYLIHRRFGFVVPLLLHQRLITKKESIAPPDFLVLKKDGRVFGVEVGYWKEDQSTKFVTATSLPTISAELDGDQPFRCPKCQQWITYCNQIIESYSKGASSPNPLVCSECKYFDSGKCPDIIFFGEVAEVEKGDRRYHYRCVAGEPSVKKLAAENTLKDYLRAWFPTVSMIDKLAEES